MPTFTALTTLPGLIQAEALGEAMEVLHPAPTGVAVIEVEDGSGLWEVGGYFTEPPDQAGLSLLAVIHGAKAFAVSRLDDRDWVAQVKRELTPVTAGRFVVFGSHDADSIPGNKIGLEIEAAMAFGTGHHATTLGCLLALDGLVRKGLKAHKVADIGSGTGVLAMAAAKVWKADVIASDIDLVATATARANIAANGVAAQVRCVTAPGFRHRDLLAAAPFDLVFANILAAPLRRLAPDMAAHLAPAGVAILSGILSKQALRVEATYKSWGFTLVERRVIGEWTTLVLRRGA